MFSFQKKQKTFEERLEAISFPMEKVPGIFFDKLHHTIMVTPAILDWRHVSCYEQLEKWWKNYKDNIHINPFTLKEKLHTEFDLILKEEIEHFISYQEEKHSLETKHAAEQKNMFLSDAQKVQQINKQKEEKDGLQKKRLAQLDESIKKHQDKIGYFEDQERKTYREDIKTILKSTLKSTSETEERISSLTEENLAALSEYFLSVLTYLLEEKQKIALNTYCEDSLSLQEISRKIEALLTATEKPEDTDEQLNKLYVQARIATFKKMPIYQTPQSFFSKKTPPTPEMLSIDTTVPVTPRLKLNIDDVD